MSYIGECLVHAPAENCLGLSPHCRIAGQDLMLPEPSVRTQDEPRFPAPAKNLHEEHELEFEFDSTSHPRVIRCSCGKTSRVEML